MSEKELPSFPVSSIISIGILSFTAGVLVTVVTLAVALTACS